MYYLLRHRAGDMNDRPDVIKPSHIAAARLKVAIAERKGEKVADWIRELASRDLTGTAVGHQGHRSEAADSTSSSQPEPVRDQEPDVVEDPPQVLSRAAAFGVLADTSVRLQAQRDSIRALAHQRAAKPNGANGAITLIGQGLLLEEQGDVVEAKRVYREAIDSRHADATPMAEVGLAILLEREGDVAGAKAAYQHAIDSGHVDAAPTAAVGLGLLLADQGDVAGAKAAYQHAIDSGHPKAAPTAAVGLGLLLADQGDVAGAKAAYQQAIDSGDDDLIPTARRFLRALP